MSTDFEKLNIVLAARDREFARAMERNTRRVDRFARDSNKNLGRTSKKFDLLAGAAKRLLPALAAGAVVAQVKKTVTALDDIGKTADKIGLTTDALQELRVIAESSGVAQSSFDSSIERLNKRLGEAELGAGAAAKTLKQMGLSASELTGMGLDQALSVIADNINKIPDPAERAARAAALFGREGVGMLNMLREGSAGMAQMRAEARALGVVVDESLVRGAEDAQTKLDLMGRVISAQLSSALIELAPLLVGAATTLADLIRMFAGAAGAVRDFLDPQTELEIATANLVAGMGDEIRQTRLLSAELGRGARMSQQAAERKLTEAKARHQNVAAIIAERRALALGSTQFADLTAEIEQRQDALSTLQGSRADEPALGREDAFYETQEGIAAAINARQALLDTDEAMAEQLAATQTNIATLEAGIAGASGGVVDLGGSLAEPIENSERLKAATGGVRREVEATVPELSDYSDVLDRVSGVFGRGRSAGLGYRDALATVEEMHAAGKLSAEDYRSAVGLIETEFEAVAAAAESLEQAAESTLVSIITRSKSASDAVGGLLAQLGNMAAQSAVSGLFDGLFDGLFSGGAGGGSGGGGGGIGAVTGNILKGAGLSFEGGGDTGDGPRSGGLDGKGGFLAMLHPRENVVDHAAGGGGGAGGVNVSFAPVIDARGADQAAVDRLERGLRKMSGEFEARTVRAVQDAKTRRLL